MSEIRDSVWIPSKTNTWDLATVIADNGDGNITIDIGGEKKEISKANVHRADSSHFQDHDDLCRMNHLHEAPLLDCLRRRFAEDKIYTTTGDVLISVNPFKAIPGLYETIIHYLDIPDDGFVDPTATSPHVYKIANMALVEMIHGKHGAVEGSSRNQSIVVSGESGAGKTEASKHVMHFLIEADQESGNSSSEQACDEKVLGEKIKNVLLQSNFILEAFGNSKTVRNDNSSRFGKYIKLQYSADNRLVSAFTETFLLEKSRLMNINANERNYHFFYQFLRHNKNQELSDRLLLKQPEHFKMLLDVNGNALSSSEDALYDNVLAALRVLGTTDEEIDELLKLIGAVLHCGNVVCTMLDDHTPTSALAHPDEEYDGVMGNVKISCTSAPLTRLTEWLGLSPQTFVGKLTTQRVKAGSRRSVSFKRLNQTEIMNNVAALMKWLYSSLFNWLIRKINFAHCSVTSNDRTASKFIGILDIFGFEILQTNSFEQLCINFTNERLQQQFNEFVFDREQVLYSQEGIDWTTISYRDNQHVIDLIGKKPTGLLILLEGQGMLNRGSSDEAPLLSTFNQTHDKKNSAYEKSRFGNDGKFSIKHFAGDVTYNITGFLDKNNDALQDDLMELMLCSTNIFIQNAIIATSLNSTRGVAGEAGFIEEISPQKIVKSLPVSNDEGPAKAKLDGTSSTLPPPPSAPSGGGNRLSTSSAGKKMASAATVSFQFRNQLDLLLATLRSTSPHYIKCVKPNTLKKPEIFDASMVLEQLKYSGALEVVRIRQEG
jgi:myosin-5